MNDIDELLTRGVDTIYPTRDELEKVLKSGKKLRVYQGFDPTSPELHIGHLVGLRKLRQWQELGHEVIFLIGDFTGMIGDPTGKDTTRKVLTQEQVLENAKTYKEQASKILRFDGENPVLIKYNSEWLAKMSAIEFIELSGNLSIQQVMERDMFQKRFENNMDVAMNEFLYPVMQGYDSVAMDVDIEVGGTDQMFNMMMGRKLMRNIKKKEKFVMTTPILADETGKKIGKTEGNAIAFNDNPADFYRKIMALGDDVITKGLEYLTDVPMNEITEIKKKLDSGENPINSKKKLAFEITKQLHGEQEALSAADAFGKTVQNKETPEEMQSVDVVFSEGRFASDLLTASGLVTSNSEAKRVIEQGGMTIDNRKITDPKEIMNFKDGMVLVIKKGNQFKKVKIVL
jgi:tyrosyl-tRNA synthetase